MTQSNMQRRLITLLIDFIFIALVADPKVSNNILIMVLKEFTTEKFLIC